MSAVISRCIDHSVINQVLTACLHFFFDQTAISTQIFLRETYAPRLLAIKAKRLRKETGNDKLRTPFDRPDRTMASVIGHGMLRPMIFLATEPIVQVLAAYMAVLYGRFRRIFPSNPSGAAAVPVNDAHETNSALP
jgi:hypothetical protein